MPDRALAPVIGVVLMVALVVILSGVLAVFVLGIEHEDAPPQASLSATIDAEHDRFVFVHEGGDTIQVDRVEIEITIDGEPLDHQPPVPFFSTTGFQSGPRGAFNPASDTTWAAGERASFSMACSNAPKPTRDSRVRVVVFVDDDPIATLVVTPE